MLFSQQPRHVPQGHRIRDKRSIRDTRYFPMPISPPCRDMTRNAQQAHFLRHGLGTGMARMTRNRPSLGLIAGRWLFKRLPKGRGGQKQAQRKN
jgi:hypothetical protein